MFRKTQAYYDAVYNWKDYAAESRKLEAIIAQHKRSSGSTLLDVACGTGAHLVFLRKHFRSEGLDLDAGMLRVARGRLGRLRLHRGDMRSFDLGKEFDAVVCLFGSIGYVGSGKGLESAVRSMARHTKPGGVVIVEPWILPEAFQKRHHQILTAEGEGFRVARASRTSRKGRRTTIEFHYTVVTTGRIEAIDEVHELYMFSKQDYLAAFRRAGLSPTFYKRGIAGRGLVVGRKPLH